MTIHSLQPRMSYEQAMRKLNGSGPFGWMRRWLIGPLRGVAGIYLPYHLYKVTIDDRGRQSICYYAVDAATGTLDPYQFAAPPAPHAWVEVETRNSHPVRLNEGETRKLAADKVRRLLYLRGFFRVANPNITAELVQKEFYIPYWAGFYGDQQNLSLTVLNAVRQTVEGSKARRLIETWLLEPDSRRELNLAF